jgi:hypothetical protein
VGVPIGWHASSTEAPQHSLRAGSVQTIWSLSRCRAGGPVVPDRLPLVVAVVDGERYLVSMLGEHTNWVRNVKAAGGDVALVHGRREEVHLEEVAPDRRAPVLKAYLQRATNASAHLPIDKDAPLAEFERVSPQYPVFRVVSRDNTA